MGRILCVAEKPSIAKAVANHLAGREVQAGTTGSRFIKNYIFNYRFNNYWGDSEVVFTSVVGHIKDQDFPERYKWGSCQPRDLFEAEIVIKVDDVCSYPLKC